MAEDPAGLLAEAVSGRKPIITVRILASVAVAAVTGLVGVGIWTDLHIMDHEDKTDDRITDIRVAVEDVKKGVEAVDGKVAFQNVLTNQRMDAMGAQVTQVFKAEFPSLEDANKAREYYDSHSAPAAHRRRHHHHAPAEDIGITAPRWTATL